MRRRIRVGWLAPEDCILPLGPQRGSISTAIARLSSLLADRCQIVVATREHPTLGIEEVKLEGVKYVRERARGDVLRGVAVELLNKAERKLGLPDPPYAGRRSYYRGYARAHAERLRRESVDVVQLHNTSQWVPVLRAALPRTPIVLRMDCEWLAEIPRAQGLERLRQVDRVLGTSEQIAAQIRECYPERAHVVDVLPNGVDVHEFKQAAEVRATRRGDVATLRSRLGLGDGPVILFVGRLSAEKGIHVLLEAMPRVLERVSDVQVLLCGQAAGLRSPLPTRERRELREHPEWRTRYIDHLHRLAQPLGGRVVFAGRVPAADLPLAFALADVYVQPSIFEAYGLPVVEAMASGLPVIVSDGGALPEHVENGVTGYVVPVGDAGTLGDMLIRVLADRELAARLGRSGLARARHTLTWETAADRLLQVYEELAAAQHRVRVRQLVPDPAAV